MIKECAIHLDGSDKSGKSSLRKKIIEVSNGKVLVFVRTYISQILYSRIYKRNINERFFIEDMKRTQDIGHRFFLLTASTDIVRERFIAHNEKDMPIDDIDYHKKEIEKILNELRDEQVEVNVIDTSKSIDENVREVLEKLQ
jgi:thymidylate kinase